MAQQQSAQNRPQPMKREPEIDLDQILDQALAATKTPKGAKIAEKLSEENTIAKIEQLLPDKLRGQASRFVRRAMLTFSQSEKLQACTANSFILTVLRAAELGLAIDGRLAHAVPFNKKWFNPQTQREETRKEAQLVVDYKGIVAVARRIGAIKDAHADVIYAGDRFEAYRDGAVDVLRHERNLAEFRNNARNRRGAYAIITRHDGTWRYELMDPFEIGRIRAKSPAKDSGPWVTDEDEMWKKTVIRRAMKLYQDDPGVVRLLEILDEEAPDEPTPAAPVPLVGRQNIFQRPPAQAEVDDGDEGAAVGEQEAQANGKQPAPAAAREPGMEEEAAGQTEQADLLGDALQIEKEDAGGRITKAIEDAKALPELAPISAELLKLTNAYGQEWAKPLVDQLEAKRTKLTPATKRMKASQV